MASPEPEPLLPRVARGDADAVKACIDRFGPLVWSLARRMLSDRDLAEDVVQEIFIDLWRSAGRYEPSRAAETSFVATIARRRLIDARRRIGRALPTQPVEETALPSEDAGLRGVEIGDEAARARAALARLRPEERRVLQLSIHDGWTHTQIAERTKLPLGTVKSHIRRGLERVTRMLAAPEGSGGVEEARS